MKRVTSDKPCDGRTVTLDECANEVYVNHGDVRLVSGAPVICGSSLVGDGHGDRLHGVSNYSGGAESDAGEIDTSLRAGYYRVTGMPGIGAAFRFPHAMTLCNGLHEHALVVGNMAPNALMFLVCPPCPIE